MMDRRRFGSVTLQKKVVEQSHSYTKPKPKKSEQRQVPDLTDFMNDMFFGAVKVETKAYNLTGEGFDDEEDGFDDSMSSTSSSRMTQEWLEEARRMVASSPIRNDSPSRLGGSPRFAAVPGKNLASVLDRRDPLSRSARRHRAPEGVGEEILTKSGHHTRKSSDSFDAGANAPAEQSPASHVQNWLSNILKPSNINSNNGSLPDPLLGKQQKDCPISSPNLEVQNLAPRQSTHQRKSRFHTESPGSSPCGIPPPPSRRGFKPDMFNSNDHSSQSTHTKTASVSSESETNKSLSPPRNLVESAHRRSISRATCSVDKIAPKANGNALYKEMKEDRNPGINAFLKNQRIKILKAVNKGVDTNVKVILSDSSNSTSSMVAAICYAWLLENRIMQNKEEECLVVPVMNMKRERMWKQRQAAWLFHNAGLDSSSLLFADEVDLEGLMMSERLKIVVVRKDILRANGKAGSQCTMLTDNYCEDAYDLLHTPILNKLLLAGILLDTLNLSASAQLSKMRDSEAVQLLLVGSEPNYQKTLFDQLMQDKKDNAFLEVLRTNYGKPPSESGRENGARVRTSNNEPVKQNTDKTSDDARNGKAHKDGPKPEQQTQDASRGKNKFFLAKLFGFGSN